MSGNSSSGRLNPIYDALDAHQYNRAIKLASALPETNILGKALLAHAYTRAGQKYNALVTIGDVLGQQYYFELKYEIDTCLEATLQRQAETSSTDNTSSATAATTTTTTTTTTSGSSFKKGKKGKKKLALTSPKQQEEHSSHDEQQSTASVTMGADLIDQLNAQPTLPDNFEMLAPREVAITDETILSTLAVSLQVHKLSFTSFQMYASAASALPAEMNLRKAFTSGLAVLAVPTKWKPQESLEAYVLSHMQATSLQLARLSSSLSSSNNNFPLMLATSWAAQSSLWQLEWLPHDEKRSMILPRLAQSMAQRLAKQEEEKYEQLVTSSSTDITPNTFRNSAEILQLNFRAYKLQSKWDEMLQSIHEGEATSPPLNEDSKSDVGGGYGDANNTTLLTSEFGVSLTHRQLVLEKSSVLQNLCRWNDAKILFERLIHESPDDWFCWKRHLECSILEERMHDTEKLVESILDQHKDRPFQLRGPHLMRVEISFQRIKESASSSAFDQLASSIMDYGKCFARRANCAFSDVEKYLDHLIRSDQEDARNAVIMLLDFTASLRVESLSTTDGGAENDSPTNSNDRRYKLRAYIFCVKVTHKLLSAYSDLLEQYLPDWKELVSEWKATTIIPISEEIQKSQRDVMPNDDLMLLAVQQLMHQLNGPTHDSDIVPAVLLEMAIDHSPDNAYLKIAAMEVYHRLNAPTRLWEMFQGIGLKHIQLDSCSFVVLPYMLEGGLYNEAIELSSSLLRFQKSSSRDCEGYAEKAMENGRLSKADEFLAFQRKKLNPSLTFQFCKGLILDSAPLFATALPRKKADDNPLLKGGLGISQGIVGKADDMERAIQMIVEKDNPYAALSVLSWASNGTFVDGDNFSDNRDLSLLTYFKILTKPLVERKDVMLKETLRRGYFHGLVVRAALCVDATKGPKKGKLVKPTEQLTKRTQSLLDSVLSASESLTDIESLDDLYRSLSETLYSLCRFLAIVNAGLPVVNNEDSLPGREERASEMIHEHCRVHLSEALCLLNNSTDLNLIYYIVPSFIVPIFALFRMSANVCDTYGWGKRKAKSKICATAMAAFAADFNQLVQGLIKCVGSLPSSSPPEDLESRSQTIDLTGDETSLLDPTILMSTVKNVQEARYRKRLRIEPILQEMDEYLDEFNFTD